MDEEEEELLDIDEVPSFFSPSTKPPAFFDNDNIVSAKCEMSANTLWNTLMGTKFNIEMIDLSRRSMNRTCWI